MDHGRVILISYELGSRTEIRKNSAVADLQNMLSIIIAKYLQERRAGHRLADVVQLSICRAAKKIEQTKQNVSY